MVRRDPVHGPAVIGWSGTVFEVSSDSEAVAVAERLPYDAVVVLTGYQYRVGYDSVPKKTRV